MDCEKFENTLLDELYDELDEVTSAAAKRHVGGCSRCASLLSGFKATRRVAVLEMVEPSADLEDRILAATKEAQKVVPMTLGHRVSNVVSRAGSWAMRPQTAMAALFLLMIGSSALLLRGKHASPSSAMTVSDEGEPVPSATAATVDHPTEPGAAESKEAWKTPPAAVAATPPLPAASAAAQQAFASAPPPSDLAKGGDGTLDRRAATGSGPTGKVNLSGKSDVTSKLYALNDDDGIGNAAPPAGAPAAHSYEPQGGGGAGSGAASPAPAPMPKAWPAKPVPPRKEAESNVASNGYGQAQASRQSPADYAAPAAPPAAAPAEEGSESPFDAAMAAYNGGDYAAATTLFDKVATSGDANAALWAARSVREGSGCPSAASRFDQLAARGGVATATRYDAMFDAGRCYKAMQQSDRARAYFNVLLGVPRYVDRAKSELASMGPMVVAKRSQAQAPTAPAQQAAPNNVQQVPAAAAPPPRQAAPATPAPGN